MNHKLEALEKSNAVIEFAMDGTILRANERFLNIIGYAEHELINRNHTMLVGDDDARSPSYRHQWARLNRGEHVSGEARRYTKSGQPVWIHGSYFPLLDEAGQPYRIMKLASDITRKKRRDADFAGQISAIRVSQAVVEFSLDGTLTYANYNFLNLVGYKLAEVRGKHHAMFVSPQHRASREYRQLWDKLRGGSFHSTLCERIGSQGQVLWLLASYNPVRDENGELKKIVKFAIDQTVAVKDHLQVKYLSEHDPLTDLPNRTGFHRVFDATIARASEHRGPALLLIDLDEFKAINDTHGHAAGDLCLTTAAARIRTAVPQALAVARLGGDEFTVVFDIGTTLAEAQSTATRIIEAVQAPFAWQGRRLRVGASIGIATDGGHRGEMLRRADVALYAAKDAGRGTFRVFDASMDPSGAGSVAEVAPADVGMVPAARPLNPLVNGQLRSDFIRERSDLEI